MTVKSKFPIKIFIMEDIDGRNIVFKEETEHCLWKGVEMTPEVQIEMFGLDFYESIIDLENGFMMVQGCLKGESEPKVFINGKNYKDCVEKYVKHIRDNLVDDNNNKISADFLDELLIVEPIPKYFKLDKIIQFEKDIDHYYELKKRC